MEKSRKVFWFFSLRRLATTIVTFALYFVFGQSIAFHVSVYAALTLHKIITLTRCELFLIVLDNLSIWPSQMHVCLCARVTAGEGFDGVRAVVCGKNRCQMLRWLYEATKFAHKNYIYPERLASNLNENRITDTVRLYRAHAHSFCFCFVHSNGLNSNDYSINTMRFLYVHGLRDGWSTHTQKKSWKKWLR